MRELRRLLLLRTSSLSLTALLAFLLLIGAATVLAFKALPVGFIRWHQDP
ncbi:hypothetical protein EDD30_3176 [Couchioplanes caeruleus]|uniref:Uncharacterized protein n=1 Tax=Couchioplanes caeruleus TaxID=56438 RepID=A0A3N1GJ70_9ACTN|nr:hypothetical protein EDD30_3176 [Couchioplanes caeruleus]